jgi:hypothetical protein
VTDVAFPTNADFSGFQTPRAAIPLWMPELYVHGYAAKTASVSMDQAGDVQHQVWMNAESVEFVDRKPAGKMTVEAVTVATKDYFSTLRAVTKAPFAMRHGTASGNSIVLMGPKVQLETIEETEVNGVGGLRSSAPSGTPTEGTTNTRSPRCERSSAVRLVGGLAHVSSPAFLT